MKAYRLHDFSGPNGLRLEELPDPVPATGQVLIRMRAFSLNYRDLMMCKGVYNPKARLPCAMGSDGAGEVIAIGASVTRFRVGQRVASTFFRGWIDGAPPRRPLAALGAPPADGVLADLTVFDEHDAVVVPEHLSWESAATLPCAAVTAWRSLVDIGHVSPGETVLLLGTGGVSIFALQFALLAGASVIITSSSDRKLERARTLGASGCINYRSTPEWEREVLKITSGHGVDHVGESARA